MGIQSEIMATASTTLLSYFQDCNVVSKLAKRQHADLANSHEAFRDEKRVKNGNAPTDAVGNTKPQENPESVVIPKAPTNESLQDDHKHHNAVQGITGRTGSSDLVRNDQYPIGRQNAHPRDHDIFMKESTHTYVMRGSSKFMISVTTLLADYFPHFNAVAVSESKQCQRSKKYRGMSPAQIRQEWDYQRDLGTRLHAKLEHYYQGLLTAEDARKDLEQLVEWSQFEDWDRREIKTRTWVMYHPEWMIFDEDLYIAGSMDAPFALSADDHGNIIIVDYKRTTGIDKDAFGGATGFGPCSTIPDSKVGHYTVQLNVYKWILEKRYAVKVVGMYLAVFHPDQEFPDPKTPKERTTGTDGKPCKYRFIQVESKPDMVDEIMRLRRVEVSRIVEEHRQEQQEMRMRLPVAQQVLLCGSREFSAEQDVVLAADLECILQTLPCECIVRCHETLGNITESSPQVLQTVQKYQTYLTSTLLNVLGLQDRDPARIIMEYLRQTKETAGTNRAIKVDAVICMHEKLWDDPNCKKVVTFARKDGIPVKVLGNE